MKAIPKWMHSPMTSVAHPQSTARQIAAILDIESREYKAAGRKDAARALRHTASRLRHIAAGASPVQSFNWSEIATGLAAPQTVNSTQDNQGEAK